MVAWLSSIKEKNLDNCGKFVLTGDMSQLSITKVDLSSMNTLEGTLGSRSVVRHAPTPRAKNLPQNSHPFMHHSIIRRYQGPTKDCYGSQPCVLRKAHW